MPQWQSEGDCTLILSFFSFQRPKSMIQTPTRPVSSQSISRTPGSTNDFKLEVGMSVFCNNELGTIKLSVLKIWYTNDFKLEVWMNVFCNNELGMIKLSVLQILRDTYMCFLCLFIVHIINLSPTKQNSFPIYVHIVC